MADTGDRIIVNKARYIMVGGFLGAGKSTAIGRFAQSLVDSGKKVGLITNDQGSGLVDTTNLKSQGFPVEEISGGCFCCRFNSLRDAAQRLTTENRPDVFIAEPVGSCTDLVASVSYPLRRIYGDEFDIAPLSVLVDPIRAMRILGLEPGRKFSPKVVYVYEKQLEEADTIVINKSDLIDDNQLKALQKALSLKYPEAKLLNMSARNGNGLDAWYEKISSEEILEERLLQIDYDTYAEGEALLGWLNCTIELTGHADANELLVEFAGQIQEGLDREGAEVAHLKMTLSPGGEPGPEILDEIALVSLVRQDFVPELTQRLSEPVNCGQIIVNLRAESKPETLRKIVVEEISKYVARSSLVLELEHLECFSPPRPVPTHRITSGVARHVQ